MMKSILNRSQYRYTRFKSVFEVFLAAILITLLLPLFLLIAFLIKIDSKGDVLFRQIRPGLNGKLFVLYKFRTMYTEEETTEFRLTETEDRRLTSSGKIIRKYHLDELPQLFNVLKGEMSFVGPRPVPNELYPEYKRKIDSYDLRHIIKPGITGLAQIVQGYTNTLEQEREKLAYDLLYIRSLSFSLDFEICMATVFGENFISGRMRERLDQLTKLSR